MKKTQLTFMITVLAVFCLFWGFSAARTPTPQPQTAASSVQNIEKHPKYTVRVYQNVLAVYRGDEQEPWRVTNIHLSSLREYDQTLMKNGFPLYTDADLNMFLEDYGS